MARIELKGVRKSFQTIEVIHGVDLDIEDGAFTVFVGPSGCGKSTLLRMMAGLEEVTAGQIDIDGKRCAHLMPAARGMPSERFAPRGTATPPRTTGRNQPATPTRAAPATQRPAPRSNPEAPVRSVPAARPAPQRESRPAPQPYQAPRRESRPAPAPEQYRAPVQQRSMPQPPRSQPQPQQRPQPPARKDTSQDKKKKDDNGGP